MTKTHKVIFDLSGRTIAVQANENEGSDSVHAAANFPGDMSPTPPANLVDYCKRNKPNYCKYILH